MNHHKAAIDILMARPDSAALIVEIAKRNPAVLVRAYAAIQEASEPWKREVARMLRDSDYIPAIKATREATGWGLKEAKDYCDRERSRLGIAVPA